jgi:hypothetical protein
MGLPRLFFFFVAEAERKSLKSRQARARGARSFVPLYRDLKTQHCILITVGFYSLWCS